MAQVPNGQLDCSQGLLLIHSSAVDNLLRDYGRLFQPDNHIS